MTPNLTKMSSVTISVLYQLSVCILDLLSNLIYKRIHGVLSDVLKFRIRISNYLFN